MEPADGFLIVSGIIYSQIFYIRNYSMITQQHEGISMKIVATPAAGTRLTCLSECLQQDACLHSHSTTSTCYLLGTDALIGQDTTYSLQPHDTVYSVYQNAGKHSERKTWDGHTYGTQSSNVNIGRKTKHIAR